MKNIKIIVGSICLGLVACAFLSAKKPILTSSRKPALQTKTDETLNGYKKADAQNWIGTFAKNKNYLRDKSLKRFSVWFSRDEISKMITILEKENGRVNGVRFYLGSKSQDAAGTMKDLTLLLVTTQLQTRVPVSRTVSSYNDYWDHDLDLTTQTPLGTATCDGDLYDNKSAKIPNTCVNSPSGHFLKHHYAYRAVNRRNKNKNGRKYSTISDTFDSNFILDFFKLIVANQPTNQVYFDGLRVYLGNGFKWQDFKNHDIMILMPTYNNKHDYFGCLEGLGTFNKVTKTSLDLINKWAHRFVSYTATGDGGYDKGELCPEVCDIDLPGDSSRSQVSKPKSFKKKNK